MSSIQSNILTQSMYLLSPDEWATDELQEDLRSGSQEFEFDLASV